MSSFVGSTVNTAGGNQTNQTFVYYNVDRDKERRDITEWLSKLNFSATQSDFFDRSEKGTGSWLLGSRTFQNWRNGISQTLWCPGNPGAGKTFMASIVINHLRMFFNDCNVGIACIYCNYKEQTTQTATTLIASLLKQLVQDAPAISDHIKAFHRSHQNKSTFPTLHEVITALEMEIKAYTKIFIVVDALDECSESDESRANLLSSLRSLTGPINIMVTSRYLPSIEQHFHKALRINIRAAEEDVTMFIQTQLGKHPHLIRLQNDITTKIIENAKGMFLVARLHMNVLTHQKNIKGVKKALDQLPSDTDAIYDQAMERIEQQLEADRELAKRVLSWITYARRPLTLEELQHAFAVSPDTTKMDPDDFIFDTQLTSVCAGLVVVDGQRTIRLAHYTTQQYFENQRESRFPNAEADIAATCLRYLSLDVFARGYRENYDNSLLKSNPFLKYAATNWVHHVRCHQETVKDVAMDFCRDDSKVACISQVMLASRSRDDYQFFPTGVHIAAFFNLDLIARYQLENGANPTIMDIHGLRPIHIAAREGNEDVMMILVEHDGVDADSKGEGDATPLSHAALQGHEGVVKLLLARDDVDADSKDSVGRTPLSYAAQFGHEGVVKLLITRDNVDADSKNSIGRTPLSYAALRGHGGVVKLLVARDDVDADSKDKSDATPLSHAAQHGHEGIVKLLVARDNVAADSKDSRGRTPLSYAAQRGYMNVVKPLVARDDVDADSKDRYGATPLSYAALNGHEGIVNLLVAHDDVGAGSKDSMGRTPLSNAAQCGHEGIVNLLVARDDVDADSKDQYEATPLSHAASNGHEGIVKLLVVRDDVDVDSKDSMGRTPLSYAASNGHEGIVKLLVAHDDVGVDSKDSFGRTPLSYAAEDGHEGITKLLVARDDVDVNSEDSSGQTPLSYAAEDGHEGIAKLLAKRKTID